MSAKALIQEKVSRLSRVEKDHPFNPRCLLGNAKLRIRSFFEHFVEPQGKHRMGLRVSYFRFLDAFQLRAVKPEIFPAPKVLSIT